MRRLLFACLGVVVPTSVWLWVMLSQGMNFHTNHNPLLLVALPAIIDIGFLGGLFVAVLRTSGCIRSLRRRLRRQLSVD